MSVINITNARLKLYELTKQILESHEHVVVTGKKGNIVMLAEEDFEALLETAYLQSVPGLAKDAKLLNDSDESDLISRDALVW